MKIKSVELTDGRREKPMKIVVSAEGRETNAKVLHLAFNDRDWYFKVKRAVCSGVSPDVSVSEIVAESYGYYQHVMSNIESVSDFSRMMGLELEIVTDKKRLTNCRTKAAGVDMKRFRILEVNSNKRIYKIQYRMFGVWFTKKFDKVFPKEYSDDVVRSIDIEFSSAEKAEDFIRKYNTLKYKGYYLHPCAECIMNSPDYEVKYYYPTTKYCGKGFMYVGTLDEMKEYLDIKYKFNHKETRVVKIFDIE